MAAESEIHIARSVSNILLISRQEYTSLTWELNPIRHATSNHVYHWDSV